MDSPINEITVTTDNDPSTSDNVDTPTSPDLAGTVTDSHAEIEDDANPTVATAPTGNTDTNPVPTDNVPSRTTDTVTIASNVPTKTPTKRFAPSNQKTGYLSTVTDSMFKRVKASLKNPFSPPPTSTATLPDDLYVRT